MASQFQEIERIKAENLIKSDNPVFYGGKAGKYFRTRNRDFVLLDGYKNLYSPIANDVIKYFQNNSISWWGGSKPTGHVLSSQVACINHLFQVRNDRIAVLSIIQNICNEFIDVMPINTDKYLPAYIQFEAVSEKDHLNEGRVSRGNNCTSIDALIYAKHKDGSNWLIPIEWKYTEYYNNQNKALEGSKIDPVNCKGEIRKKRYTNLINNSDQLINTDHTCFYFEPFYQLMRQTLWAEQMIRNKQSETIKADNYLHIHIIPSNNKDLLDKIYKCSKKNMEDTWKSLLKDPSKYLIITPQKIISYLDKEKYSDLISFLKTRY